MTTQRPNERTNETNQSMTHPTHATTSQQAPAATTGRGRAAPSCRTRRGPWPMGGSWGERRVGGRLLGAGCGGLAAAGVRGGVKGSKGCCAAGVREGWHGGRGGNERSQSKNDRARGVVGSCVPCSLLLVVCRFGNPPLDHSLGHDWANGPPNHAPNH